MNRRATFVTLGLALAALAGWPAFVAQRSAASDTAVAVQFTPAPVTPDYLERDRLAQFYEAAVHRTPSDQIMARMLGGQYLMRFRERGDVGDLRRARIAAQRSLAIQPRMNSGAESELAAVAL